MTKIIEKNLFIENLKVLGSLSSDNHIVHDLQININYSMINQSPIEGSIYGNKKKVKELRVLFNEKQTYLKLSSEYYNQTIQSDYVSLKNLSMGPTPVPTNNEDSYIFEISKFELRELKIIDSFDKLNIEKRSISFLLNGPSEVWNIHQFRKYNEIGKVENQIHNSTIELDIDFDLSILPRYFYDTADDVNEKIDISTNILCLKFETKLSEEKLSNSDFITKSKDIIEDVLILSSYLSRHWITWFGYQFERNGSIERFYRVSRNTYDGKVDFYDYPINYTKIRDFLRIGFNSLQNLRKLNIDLRMPITYCISGHEGRFVEEKFAILFLGLEKLKDIFSINNGLTKIVKKNLFQKFKSNLKPFIIDYFENHKISDRIIEKTPELNRFSLKFLLDEIFLKYDIKWTDIYPENSNFTLIRTRDTLFHSSEKIEIDSLINELNRLIIILDRIILKLLGWKDLSETVKPYDKKYLRIKNDKMV